MGGPSSVPGLAEKVQRIEWYHSIRLPGGIVTPGVGDTSSLLAHLHLPVSLAGRSVLDIGAWDGFYSFEAAGRGAARVLATDSYVWTGKGWGGREGFALAREALGLKDRVKDQLIDVMDLAPEAVGGTFDVVLFLGVLYHLTDPLGALKRVSSVCSDLLILETEMALNWIPYPAARLYPGSDLGGDASNWFAFNPAALTSLLKELRFSEVSVVHRTPPTWRLISAVREWRRGKSFRAAVRSGRIVIHARRRPHAET